MFFFVIVNYYSTNLVLALLDSLSKNILVYYKVIIVNNSPEDNSIHQLQSNQIIIIDAEKNLGFGAGCNIAIQYIYSLDKKAIIWLINPDTLIDPQADSYILKSFKDNPSIAILGTKIRDTKGKVWFSAGKFNRWTGYIKQEANQVKFSLKTEGHIKCRWVSGCSLIINLSQFNCCPNFDPQYFLYYEDADFCEKYYRQGYFIAITNDILVTHIVSAINGKNKETLFKNFTYSRLYFIYKNATWLALIVYLIYLPMIILFLFVKNRDSSIGRFQGLIAFLKFYCNRNYLQNLKIIKFSQ